ncbi:MAG TPA: hypothetical protein DCW74_05710 [Alteromonas australica]|uniref:Uncharacterized protein n=1 Tax=Alteromonas australica TaxID=589873 RepID=A0A350P1Q1_9ALTE|nr:hypothetical protein [Alteromonas australica]|tara:strand:+ start:147 stop:629 length:483 start_codon:yes stop_codon:yes gene_type:complete
MTSLYKKYQRKIDDQQKIQQDCEDEMISIEGQIKSLKNRLADVRCEARKAYEAQDDLVKQRDRAINAQDRREVKKLCDKYDLTVEREIVDSYYDYSSRRPVNDYTYWVDCPKWLDKDPIEDGHYAYNLGDALNILEIYAKHHPDHPEHDKREYNAVPRHI